MVFKIRKELSSVRPNTMFGPPPSYQFLMLPLIFYKLFIHFVFFRVRLGQDHLLGRALRLGQSRGRALLLGGRVPRLRKARGRALRQHGQIYSCL